MRIQPKPTVDVVVCIRTGHPLDFAYEDAGGIRCRCDVCGRLVWQAPNLGGLRILKRACRECAARVVKE